MNAENPGVILTETGKAVIPPFTTSTYSPKKSPNFMVRQKSYLLPTQCKLTIPNHPPDTTAKSSKKTEIWRNYHRYLRQISKKIGDLA